MEKTILRDDTEINVLTDKSCYVLNSLSFYFSLLLTIALCKVTSILPIKFEDAQKYANMNAWDSINPEPMERLVYMVAIVAFPVLFLAARYAIGRLTEKSAVIRSCAVADIVGLFSAAALVILAAVNFSVEFRDSVPPYRYINNMLYETNMTAQLVLTAVIAVMAAVSAVLFKGAIRKVLNKIYLLPEFILLALVIVLSFDGLPRVRDSYHFEAVFYAMSQVYNGASILVDLTSQYGLYPHFLEPVFRAMGGLSVWKFQFIMSVLIAAAWISFYYFLKSIIRNRLILFMSFIAVFFFTFVNFYVDYRARDYYQYPPIRILFPMVGMLLASLYFKSRSIVLYYLIPVFLSVGALWNPDTGIMMIITWVFVLIFREMHVTAEAVRKWGQVIRKGLFHILNVFEIFSVILIIFALGVFFRSGAMPDYGEMLRFQKLYYQMGFGLMPMPDVHPWQLFLIALAAGLAFSVGGLFAKNTGEEARAKNSVVFMLSIYGTAIFAYYQGRSHDWAMVPLLYVPVALAGIFADSILAGVRGGILRRGSFGLLAVFAVLVFFLSSPLERAYTKAVSFKAGPFFHKFIKEHDRENYGFLKEHIRPGSKAYVISAYQQGVIYAETGALNPLNVPGQVEISLVSDINKVRDFLQEKGEGRIVVWDRTDGGSYVNHYNLNFRETYNIEAVFPDSQVEIYKQYDSIPKKELVFPISGKGVHLKNYTTSVFTLVDEAGNFQRNFHYDSGEKTGLNKVFSLQILLKPSIKEGINGEIAGNYSDYSGFKVVSGEENGSYRIIAGTGSSLSESELFRMEPEKWNYIAINYINGVYSLYVNGLKQFDFKAATAKSVSSFKIQYKWNSFKGIIDELKFSDAPLTSEAIGEIYKKIWTKYADGVK